MKSLNVIFPVAVALLALLGTGCHREQHTANSDAHGHEAGHAEEGVTFKEGKGLHVPPSTAKFIGLRVEDVADRKITATIRFNAEIYRAAANALIAALDGAAAATSYASAFVHQPDANQLRKGEEVSVQTASNESFYGRISEINSSLGTNSSQREVIVAINDEKAQLRHGTFVSVIAQVGEEKTVVAVPASALLRTAEGTFVYTVSGERFVRTPVKLGTVNNEFAEVTDGLYAGDQIVVHPVMTLWMAELQTIRGGKACADGH